jgi:hypothetical protein
LHQGWKKVIIAQGPRQIIAGITVYALLKSAWTDANGMINQDIELQWQQLIVR